MRVCVRACVRVYVHAGVRAGVHVCVRVCAGVWNAYSCEYFYMHMQRAQCVPLHGAFVGLGSGPCRCTTTSVSIQKPPDDPEHCELLQVARDSVR